MAKIYLQNKMSTPVWAVEHCTKGRRTNGWHPEVIAKITFLNSRIQSQEEEIWRCCFFLHMTTNHHFARDFPILMWNKSDRAVSVALSKQSVLRLVRMAQRTRVFDAWSDRNVLEYNKWPIADRVARQEFYAEMFNVIETKKSFFI